MAQPVNINDLPKEHVTDKLLSLPKDLRAQADEIIKNKFKLNKSSPLKEFLGEFSKTDTTSQAISEWDGIALKELLNGSNSDRAVDPVVQASGLLVQDEGNGNVHLDYSCSRCSAQYCESIQKQSPQMSHLRTCTNCPSTIEMFFYVNMDNVARKLGSRFKIGDTVQLVNPYPQYLAPPFKLTLLVVRDSSIGEVQLSNGFSYHPDDLRLAY